MVDLLAKTVEKLDRISSNNHVKYGIYLAAVTVFFALILLPPILGIFVKWESMQAILENRELVSQALNAVGNSFILASLVSAVDIAASLPLAWRIAKGKSKWLSVLDTLADIPFIVPTAVLGYSLLLFWSGAEGVSAFFGGPLISQGWLLVGLLHFTFSFPVALRVIVGALLDYNVEFEQASRTLGAPPLTSARTVTLSIIKPSFIAAFTLCFARSISETGATMMVAGAFINGAVFIQNMKNAFYTQPPLVSQAVYEGATVFASLILIVVSCIIFALVRILGGRVRLPMRQAWPSWERKLSYSKAVAVRDAAALSIFFLIVLLPSVFVAFPAVRALTADTLLNALMWKAHWGDYWRGLFLSYSIAAVATVLNVIMGLPVAIAIARKRLGKFSALLNVLVDVPIIVPSVALGASLRFFWKETLASVPELWLLIFAHLAITYPYFVRSTAAAIERISLELEEASRTLGAKPLTVFRTITAPLTRNSMLSGAIMVFTRSVSETGATMAVTSLKTAPVILVEWVKGSVAVAPLDIELGCSFLLLISFLILLALRLILRGKGKC